MISWSLPSVLPFEWQRCLSLLLFLSVLFVKKDLIFLCSLPLTMEACIQLGDDCLAHDWEILYYFTLIRFEQFSQFIFLFLQFQQLSFVSHSHSWRQFEWPSAITPFPAADFLPRQRQWHLVHAPQWTQPIYPFSSSSLFDFHHFADKLPLEKEHQATPVSTFFEHC